MSNHTMYLFILGRNFELSRAELKNFCDEVFIDPEKSLFIGENLKFENPRNIPRDRHQLFLDRLGGTIRFGKILGEFSSKKELLNAVWKSLTEDAKLKVGFTVYGGGKNLLSEIIYATKDHFGKIRIENYQGKNMTSGQIFDRRLLQKGHEFVIWQKENTFLLAETCANQNLRNYTLRDRQKSFRDAYMGMLPPKLAQILINLSQADITQTIIDPFCGSGTVNIEAAIMGYQTIGSDINPRFVEKSHENFAQMAEKFRYDPQVGEFLVSDATKLQHKAFTGSFPVIVTEGYLGENFTQTPATQDIQLNAQKVSTLWKHFFKHIGASRSVSSMVFCLPAWNQGRKKISIADDIFEMAQKAGFEVVPMFNGQKSFFYERDEAFVAREICVLKKL